MPSARRVSCAACQGKSQPCYRYHYSYDLQCVGHREGLGEDAQSLATQVRIGKDGEPRVSLLHGISQLICVCCR